MIYTSYFSSKKFNEKDGVAITLGGNFWKGEVYKELAPTPQILNLWKKEGRNNPKGELIYEALYRRDLLSKLVVSEVAKKLDGKVLLCFEKSSGPEPLRDCLHQ